MAIDLFKNYFDYIGQTEAPAIFHRWSLLSCVGATLGRKCHVPLGHFKIYPNMYVMLIGGSGTRKSVAINRAKKLLRLAGYENFAANKTSKEKFILDLMDKNHGGGISNITSLSDTYIHETTRSSAEMFIVSDEFQDFLGLGNLDFITLLGRLWEGRDEYEHRIKNGKSAIVVEPTIAILGGSTPTSFGLTFPPEILGQGFLSRILLIYGDITEKRISWPLPPSKQLESQLVAALRRIHSFPKFEFALTSEARSLLDAIYQANIKILDPRFVSYETRRHEHLLKLCGIIRSLTHDKDYKTIVKDDVLMANTMLCAAERHMPYALGEFGKGKFSDTSNAIMEALNRSKLPLSLSELWKMVAQDLNSQNDLVGILRGLQSIDKIQTVEVNCEIKFLPKKETVRQLDEKFLMPDCLTEEEIILGGMV